MRYLGITLTLIGVLNFASFMICCLNIGGSAGNGKIQDGRYYVSEHGRQREVSAKIFELNRIHGKSVWITHPLAMLGILIFASSVQKTRAGDLRISRP